MSRKVTPTYTLLNQITLAANSSTITFSNIPQSFADLVLIASVSLTSTTDIGVRFNGDSGTNYHRVWMANNNGSVQSSTNLSADIGYWGYNSANSYAPQTLQIFDYSAVDKHKSWVSRYGGAGISVGATAGRWASTSAITSIQLSLGTYQTGSVFSLYGIVA